MPRVARRRISRVVFVIAMLLPVIVLSGVPRLAPDAITGEAARVPMVIWLTMTWFALLTLVALIPDRKDIGR